MAPTMDDFRFDLRAPCEALLAHLDAAATNLPTTTTPWVLSLHTVLAAPEPTRQLKLAAIDALAHLLIDPTLTLDLVTILRPLLMDLVARIVHTTPWDATPTHSPNPSSGSKRALSGSRKTADDAMDVDVPSSSTSAGFSNHELVCVALAKIVVAAPQVQPFIIHYFDTRPSPADRLASATGTSSLPLPDMVVEDLLLATYRLMAHVPALQQRWNLAFLVPLTHSATATVRARCLAAHVLATAYGLADSHRASLVDQAVALYGQLDPPPAPHTYRFFMLEEAEFVESVQRQYLHPIPRADDAAAIWVTDDHLCPYVVDVCGLLLPTDAPYRALQPATTTMATAEPGLIETPTTRKNLVAIAMATSLGSPVLLEGVTGSGKTCLIEELATRLGCASNLVKIHLGDQSDGKTLLGTYIATSTPGKFTWARGVLTRAVQEGHWVVLEDIDMASRDVVSLLVPLLERRTLFIAQRGQELRAHPNFQLFATTSLDPFTQTARLSASQGLGNTLWTHVRIQPLPHDELLHVVTHKFPRLTHVAPSLLDAFAKVVEIYHSPANRSAYQSGGRYMSTRDLMKWCRRVQTLVAPHQSLAYAAVTSDENVIDQVLKEAMDVLVCMVPSMPLRRRILDVLGEAFDLPAAKLEYYATQYAPNLDVAETTMTVGRIALPIPPGKITIGHRHPFATTGHARRLLERIAVSVALSEPVLLVGETGTGKTTVVQYLAQTLHKRLHVINLSQQTESSDLMGGFKPVSVTSQVAPLVNEFHRLFAATFSVKKNQAFLDLVKKAAKREKYDSLVILFNKAVKMARDRMENTDAKPISPQLRQDWKTFEADVAELHKMLTAAAKLFFSFIEGTLVSAIRKGEWILLDEVNLATAETLESMSGLLEANGSLLLTERGDEERIPRHPEFRIFACMNPATDVGKRDLPLGLRNRFTEIYVESPDNYLDDLTMIAGSYLASCAHADPTVVGDVVAFYLESKQLAETSLYDGAGARPHFSLRTLSRALTFVASVAPMYGVRRALFEGFSMTFLTLLDSASQKRMLALIETKLLRKQGKLLKQPVPAPPNAEEFVQFESFWLRRGPHPPTGPSKPYILTPSVHRNMCNLTRSVMTGKYPVLIQGPTSSGKTSMIEYLAHLTHHKFVRINNHEHTDLQEYLGCYVSDETGKLVFKEGALVTALREGHWIVLDELNLAPTDVLEALNRLLDDNRELFIPETQQVVRPHPHFMLFATQNPPSYGGRKVLSRAFRNRFLELHFDDLPDDELHQILSQRCAIPPSYALKMISVYQELRKRRQESRLFDGKSSFVTLRDLFRWANRAATGYQRLAEDGWMILGERVRSQTERDMVIDVLHQVLKIKVDPREIYARVYAEFADRLPATVVWNNSMKRLFALTVSCLVHQEPVLLVGETGCGKTTVCQVLAALEQQELAIVNCHQHTETSDFIGSQRPTRDESDKLFEWQEGPLIQAMKDGHFFLLDEISLAEDSVLERLNSVLEPSRTILIAEKGGDAEHVTAVDGFRFLATMNPGGDYGKKELSPALRNRFTEIWTSQIEDYDDLHQIVANKVHDRELATLMLDYVTWFKDQCHECHIGIVISMRDLIAWSEFINATRGKLGERDAFLHGGCMVLLDGLKSRLFADRCLAELQRRSGVTLASMDQVLATSTHFGVGDFTIPLGPHPVRQAQHTLNAPTSRSNILRVLRALQIPSKAVLLEGSPGVGKTSLVSALAQLSGRNLVRINLSEQTDLIDLFGSDLPVEGGQAGEFAWRDGPFLAAMKAGDWVLLDELNLASQSVLEGLNACLDHRGSVYLPELDKTFDKHVEFRIFGAQNPLEEGGGRRGLPKSFLNRFTQVHVQALSDLDLMTIVHDLYPNVVSDDVVRHMLHFNSELHRKTMVTREFGSAGSPWEFNLRDVLRWLELMAKDGTTNPAKYLDMLYLQRMQTDEDRTKTLELWNKLSQFPKTVTNPRLEVTPDRVQLGNVAVTRSDHVSSTVAHVPHTMLRPLQALLKSLDAGWMTMVNGPSGSGKTSLIRLAAELTGHELVEFAMSSSVDALELLGGFEQVDRTRCLEQLTRALRKSTKEVLGAALVGQLHDAEPLNQLTALAQQEQITHNQIAQWIGLLAQFRSALELPDDSHSFHRLLAKFEELQSVAGKFEWVDGVLLDAVQHGKWILLDNANLCSPSMLDRLNPLFEASKNRHLLINERGMTDGGSFVVVEPHPNFRMFMTLDPKFGQISRAMRNRGIEVSLVDGQWSRDDVTLAQMITAQGVHDSSVQQFIMSTFRGRDAHELVMGIDYVVDLLQRGFSAERAMYFAAHNAHGGMDQHMDAETADRPVIDACVAPHPPLLLQDSTSSLIQAKTSYLAAAQVHDDHVEPAMDVLLESDDILVWQGWLRAWLQWHGARHASSRIDRSLLLTLIDKLAELNVQGSHHVLAKTIVQFLKFKVAQHHVFSQAASLKFSKMNLIQRSHAFHQSAHRMNSLDLPEVVQMFFPVFQIFETCLQQSLAQPDEAALTTLQWVWSLWMQCCVQHELNLNLLDAHVSQLLDATENVAALTPFRSALARLQQVYGGNMEAAQAAWLRLHPWTVRTSDLHEHVQALVAVDVAKLPKDLLQLTVDALTSVFLGDATQQELLKDDLPRLLALIAPHVAVPVEDRPTDESVRLLEYESKQLKAARDKSSSDWVWASSTLRALVQALSASSAQQVQWPKTAPSLAVTVHTQLLQWALANAKSVDRSWNSLYIDYQCVATAQSLWRPYPLLLSADLIESTRDTSLVGIGALTHQLQATSGLILNHQTLLEFDLLAMETDLLQDRINLLTGLPPFDEYQHHLGAAQSICSSAVKTPQDLGRAWIHVGMAFMLIAIPTSPLDPASRFSLIHQYLIRLQERLQLELHVRRILQQRDNGMTTNPSIEWLEAQLDGLTKRVQDSARQLYLRPANGDAQMHQLFAEFHSLLASVANEQSYVNQLLAGNPGPRMRDSIEVVRTSLTMFMNRTAATFPLFVDLLEPIYSGIYDILHGLSLLLHAASRTPNETVWLSALPAVQPAQLPTLIESVALSQDDKSLAHAVALLDAIATHRHLFGREDVTLVDYAMPLFQVVVERFRRKKEEEAQKRQEEAQTFKYATKSVVLEDEEFDWFKIEDDPHTLALCEEPGLNEDGDIKVVDADDEANQKQAARRASEGFQLLLHRAFNVYLELFGGWSSAHRASRMDPKEQCPPTAHPLTHLVSLMTNAVHLTQDVKPSAYDFYRHSNFKESARLRSVLLSLDTRLKALLDQWPEHAVLQQLVVIAHRIASFPAGMPLIKYVQSIEFLLEKCDEWEKFAASHVSLREDMNAMTGLIVDWRRLELHNWANLLEYYDEEQKRDGASLWLSLYALLEHHEDLSAADLLSSLDEFIMTSSIGQLSLRLQIVKALYTHFKLDVLLNTHDYYAQFLPAVHKEISQQRTVIEKELKDHVKIASWRDINVYALKLSAAKTHKQLNKCLKKYSMLLQQPLLPLISQKSDALFDDQRTAAVDAPIMELSTTVHFYPDAVAKTLTATAAWKDSRDARLPTILTKSASLATVSPLPLPLAEFTQDLIETITELKAETDAISKKPTKSEATTMLQIRKKAYADLLKQLRDLGLSWRHASVPTTADLMQQPALPVDATIAAAPSGQQLQSALVYHNRLVALMQSLPEIIGQRSPDIQGQQAERSVGYITDLFKMVEAERVAMAPAWRELVAVQQLVQDMQKLTGPELPTGEWVECSTVAHEALIMSTTKLMCDRVLYLNLLTPAAASIVQSMSLAMNEYLQQLRATYPSRTGVILFNAETLLNEWVQRKDLFRDTLAKTIAQSPRDKLVLDGIMEYLTPSLPSTSPSTSPHPHAPEDLVDGINRVTETIMIQTQHLHQFSAEERPDGVKALHKSLVEFLAKIGSMSVAHAVAQMHALRTVGDHHHVLYHMVKRLTPLLANYAQYLHATLFQVLTHHRVLAKCAYVMCINLTKIIKAGFCVPSSEEDDSDDSAAQGGEFQEVNGTGIGQGSGEKDVSDEIEDEEQVLGTKDEEQESPDQDEKQDKKKEDEGMEMENDFDGALEDLNLDEDEKGQNEGESGDEEEQDERDEAMDEVDQPEDNKVDESLWQDDEEQDLREADLDNEKVKRDTHEIQELEDDQQEDKEQQQQGEQENFDGHMDENESQQDQDETNDKAQAQDDEKKEDEVMDEADKDPTQNDSRDADGEDMEDRDAVEDLDAMDEDTPADDRQEEDEGMQDEEQRDVNLDQDQNDGQEDRPDADEPMSLDLDDQYDHQESDSEDEPVPEDAEMEEPDVNQVEEDTAPALGVQDDSTEGAQNDEEQEPDDQEQQDQTKVGLSNKDDGQDDAKESTQDMAERKGQAEQVQQDSKATDSLTDQTQNQQQQKSLGDAIKEWKKRLNMIERQQQEQQDDADQQPPADATADQEYEFLQDEDQKETDQTLGAAEPDQQQAQMPSLPDEDDREDEEMAEVSEQPMSAQAPPTAQPATSADHRNDEQQDRNPSLEDETQFHLRTEPATVDEDHDDDLTRRMTDEQEEELRQDIASRVVDWKKDHNAASSHELWFQYKTLTHNYALQLTEQLRLILEPTQAAKLTGDYKTGKRLNMKKIIPYIASDFKKDKIWLRRTKPSKRQYQILIAVDDSQSMSETKSVQLGFESVCLIARALQQLEVGNLAIAAFGNDMTLVHPFDMPFSDEAGARVLDQFTFAQQRTDVARLLESALAAFDQAGAANSGAAADTWRLMLIVSDGLCDDHERLRNLVRRAAEARVLVAFIVVDQHKTEQDSILRMSSVSFEGGKVVMRRYMDSFPFDFYIVVRDVSRLPNVLSDALRQFFAFVAQ
ncbi:hypothetical protein GGF32_000407 [Allomyces javanicus]|nr:hypothetical protein GGF32_000407 [Allomyces javanicus]